MSAEPVDSPKTSSRSSGQQDQAATQVLKEAFNFSDGEEKFIINAKIGQGILVTQEGRIPFYNFLSDEERRLFTTKTKEVTA